ncbi:MAG: LPS assembly lipoprotein LptE [Aestuariibacter sp.]
MKSRHFKLLCCLFLAATILNGCGFNLRNDYQLDEKFKQLQLISQEANAPLPRILQQRLKVFDVEVIRPNLKTAENPPLATIPTLILYPENLDRRLLSLFRSGQVAEYELIYTCRYELINSAGDTRLYEFEILREYQDDPDQVLAKSRELNLILNEMRKEAANRIIRQFSVEQI